jgi:hypothetical protein
MTRQKWTIGVVAAAFSVSLAPALWAQDNRGPQGGGEGSRANTGATTGSAGARGGDGGSSAGSSSSSSAGSSSTSGMGSSGGFSGGMTGYSPARERAPERPGAAYSGDRGGGSGGETRATPRGSSAASGGEAARGAGGSNSMYYAGETARDRAPVPAYSRPRDGRTVTGTAGERVGPPPGSGGGSPCGGRECGGYYPIYDPYYYWGYYDPYYYGYGYRYANYWMPGYGFGFGYFGYDPFLFGGYYDPYIYAFGSGQSSGGYGVGQYRGVGSLRLKVKPQNAQVYIDGYYVGLVDSFDGMFQRLEIEAGSHRVEVKAEGHEPVQFDVMVQPGETVTYKGELPRIR